MFLECMEWNILAACKSPIVGYDFHINALAWNLLLRYEKSKAIIAATIIIFYWKIHL